MHFDVSQDWDVIYGRSMMDDLFKETDLFWDYYEMALAKKDPDLYQKTIEQRFLINLKFERLKVWMYKMPFEDYEIEHYLMGIGKLLASLPTFLPSEMCGGQIRNYAANADAGKIQPEAALYGEAAAGMQWRRIHQLEPFTSVGPNGQEQRN